MADLCSSLGGVEQGPVFDQVKPPIDPSPLELEREELMRQVEALTAAVRVEYSERMRLKGRDHLKEARKQWNAWNDGLLEEKPRKPEAVKDETSGLVISRWHQARADGMIRKFERIRECGNGGDFLRFECRCCGHTHHKMVGCGHRECPVCRHDHASRVKKYFDAGRRALRREARARNIDLTLREKLLTLTSPHYGAGRVRTGKDEWIELSPTERRIEAIYQAWKIFGPWLRDFMIAKIPEKRQGEGLEELCHFFRVFEWTEGTDGLGHPHFHVYLHAPFLKQATIREAWGRALAIVTDEDHGLPIVDIRQATVKGGNIQDRSGNKSSIADELVKYMVKDFSLLGRDKFVNPVILAKVLVTMQNKRRRQTSASFSEWVELCFEKTEDRECSECEVIGGIEVRHHGSDLNGGGCSTGPPNVGAPFWAREIDPSVVVQPPPQFSFQI